MKKLLEKHGIFYGWAIVFYALVIMAVCFGIAHNCFTLYIIPVSERFGWPRRSVSAALTLMYVMQMLGSVFSGRIFRRAAVKKVMMIAVIIQPAAYFLLSFASNLPVFYLLSVIVGGCVPFLSFQAFTVIIANWFEEKRGTATGIAFMGSGLGGMIFNAVGGSLLTRMSYDALFRVYAAVIAAVAVPVVFFLVKEKPQELGLLPYGERPGTDGKFFHEVIYGCSFEEAFRKSGLYVLMLAALAIGFSTSVLSSTIVPDITDSGFTPKYAAMVNAAYLGGVSLGKVILGQMFDRMGMKRALTIAMLCLLAGLAGMYFSNLQWMHIVLVAGASLGCATGTVAYPLMTQSVMGNRDYGALSGIVMACGSLGGCIAPFFSNAVFDALASYRTAYIPAAAAAALAIMAGLLVRTMKKPGQDG